jgi:hypothetical protein
MGCVSNLLNDFYWPFLQSPAALFVLVEVLVHRRPRRSTSLACHAVTSAMLATSESVNLHLQPRSESCNYQLVICFGGTPKMCHFRFARQNTGFYDIMEPGSRPGSRVQPAVVLVTRCAGA